MINYQTGQVPSPGIILPFYATGTVAFMILCILMVWSPQSLLMHYFNPHLLAITHTAALGWGTMIIFGASYQLLPVITEKKLWSEDLAFASWYLLLAGVILLVYAFWNLRTGWVMITGGSLVTLSAVFYLGNTLLTGTVDRGDNIQRYFMATSAGWLVFTAIVGLLLAINLKYPFFSRNHMEILKIHAHLGLAGWFLQLITGVSSKLVPMFLLGRSGKNVLMTYALILQNAGLLSFIADLYFFGYSERILIYLTLVVLGIGCWLWFLADNFTNRIKKRVDFQMRHTFISMWCLVFAVVLIPVVHYDQTSSVTIVYGVLLLMGWITGIILGQSFKTLPFIVWNSHYRDLTGRVRVPLPRDLYRERWLRWQLWIYVVSVILLVIGIISRHMMIIRIATWSWLGLSLLYAINISQILLHKNEVKE